MLKIDFEREADGRWLAEIAALPGVIAYGDTLSEAQSKAEVLALRVIADKIEHGEPVAFETSDLFATA
jgi:predicted RNase H-like HicB family nuclease